MPAIRSRSAAIIERVRKPGNGGARSDGGLREMLPLVFRLELEPRA